MAISLSRDAKETGEPPLPKARDFRFLRFVDPKSPSRAAIHLLAAYATDAANFIHNGGGRSVESLVSARKFAEYLVTYIAIRDKVAFAGQADGHDRPSFAGRVDHLKGVIVDLPAGELKRIWRDASDAAHPPEGIAPADIENYKNAYRLRAADVLRDALKVGQWFRGQYGLQPWYARAAAWFRGTPA